MLHGMAEAQHSVYLQINSHTNGRPLAGALVSIEAKQYKVVSDTSGFALLSGLREDSITITISCKGFQIKTLSLLLPANDRITVSLEETEAHEEELEEVIVRSTRSSRTIRNTPTRIELIEREEVDEKSNMRPANVSMLLHESTGIQLQQTSATSANASVRVQGLDGRYTQLLKDGYPNFGNFASGLSVLEIPPLDLKQVEIIKGPASTLYGGGAIAGVINFISKDPGSEPEHLLLVNQSNIGQTNVGVYSSARKGKTGYTAMAMYNKQRAYDVDEDSFSELPSSRGAVISARLFYYPSASSRIMLGNSFNSTKMTGGDMQVIAGKPDSAHVYFERNSTIRNTTTFEWEQKVSDSKTWLFKQSLSLFSRTLSVPDYRFAGRNLNAFTDASLTWKKASHTLVSGINLVVDRFRQQQADSLHARTITGGLYVQHTWDLSEKVKLENGLRADYVSYTGKELNGNRLFLLPRLSALFVLNDQLSSRISGGLGYKAPSIFTEQTESFQYRKLMPFRQVRPEKSIGGTFDINYRRSIGESFNFSVNQLFFLTSIRSPLVLQSQAGGVIFQNEDRPVLTRGFETNVKCIYKENLKLFAGYTFVRADANYLEFNTRLPLLPQSKVNLALIYEKEKDLKLGFEAYYTGSQLLSDQSVTPAFWEMGVMAEKTIRKRYSIYLNFENFTDVRQSRYKRVVNGSNINPRFDEIWTHTEGFTFNGGIKLRF